MRIAAALFVFWNVFVFAVYGTDKICARKGKRRIREKTLILISVFLGGIGAMCGMKVFRHKTRKLKFKIAVSISFVISSAFFVICIAA